ncbi:hypothetical protein ACA910_005240 [Epithemia clementina (nom. ined.)]
MLRTTVAAFMLVALVAGTAAFIAPTAHRAETTARKSTFLQPKFLKDLGFEKPSWLPDFGGGKKGKEEASSEASTDESEAKKGEVASAEIKDE